MDCSLFIGLKNIKFRICTDIQFNQTKMVKFGQYFMLLKNTHRYEIKPSRQTDYFCSGRQYELTKN